MRDKYKEKPMTLGSIDNDDMEKTEVIEEVIADWLETHVKPKETSNGTYPTDKEGLNE